MVNLHLISKIYTKEPRPVLCCVLVIVACRLLLEPAWANLADDQTEGFNPDIELSLELESLQRPAVESRLLSAEVSAETEFRLSRSLLGYTDVVVTVEQLTLQSATDANARFIEFEELWLSWQFAPEEEYFIWVGRYAVADSTTWWWDESFVGLGLQYGDIEESEDPAWLLAFTYATNDWSSEEQVSDPEEDSIVTGLGAFVLPLSDDRRVSTFAQHQTDLSATIRAGQVIAEMQFDELDADVTTVGLRYEDSYLHDQYGELSLLVDAAYMNGTRIRTSLIGDDDAADEDNEDVGEADDEGDLGESETDDELMPDFVVTGSTTRESLSGWATNLVLGWVPSFAENTRFSLGYAFASGSGRGQDNGSRTFRQTGFQSNESFSSYYGLLLQPELANLEIVTALITHKFSEKRQAYLQYNRFSRASRFDDTFETDLDVELENANLDIGSEIALGMRFLLTDDVRLEAAFARFSPGNALGANAGDIDYYEVMLTYAF